MRFTKSFLIATTALSLSASWAAAGNGNSAFLNQNSQASATDADNTALIDQSGGNNNQVGRTGLAVQQTAGQQLTTPNEIDVVQSGDGNTIGLDQITNRGTGFLQLAQKTNGNSASITQSSDDNSVGQINQVTRFGGTYSSGNTLTILQETGNENAINRVSQERDGGDNGSVANITMRGTSNTIDRISQATKGPGAGNTMTVDISGDDNGDGTLIGFAAGTGATTSTLIQGRRFSGPQGDNDMILLISGNMNEFGVTQLGVGNTVGTLDLQGSGNQLGVYQSGLTNTVTVAAITGDDNNVGVAQLGTTNTASVTVNDNGNMFGVYQNGVSNDTTVTVSGNNNGVTSTTPILAGDALTASMGSLDFESGVIKQLGDDNSVTANITGNDNLFGMVQNGINNSISATVNGGANLSAVVQIGNGNSATFAQVGNANNLGIVQ